ncbi:hypothetical protein Q1695_003373 [Nippostrongylus brasiliensis]|nr:hypothetical protein Q1695_003373 [Nippostrongylus brasiliensis]
MCRERRHLCDKALFSSVMRVQCARTCRVCADETIESEELEECNDIVDMFGINSCPLREKLCRSQDPFLRQFVQRDCKKTCNVCKKRKKTKS